MTSFWDAVMQYMKECKIAYANRFAPPFIVSACCHWLNLENRRREFFLEHGKVANLRLHIFFVAPPGHMKCVAPHTLIQMADGSRKRAEHVEKGDWILTMDKHQKIVPAPVEDCHHLQSEKMIRVRTRTGREIDVTPEHPFLTISQWKRADSLEVGERVAVPMRLPCQARAQTKHHWTRSRVRLLAYLIAEGHLKGTPTFTNTDQVIVDEVREYVKEFGVEMKSGGGISWYLSGGIKGEYNLLSEWLKELDLYGLLSAEKIIPHEVFELPDDLIREFLQVYATCEGTIGRSQITISSMSESILEALSTLFLRVGIWTVKDENQVRLSSAMMEKFVEEIGFVPGSKKDGKFKSRPRNSVLETIPVDIWRAIEKEEKFTSWENMSVVTGYHGIRRKRKPAPSRKTLEKFAKVLESDRLQEIASSDILWDEVIELECIEGGEVVDLTVDKTHTFVANNFVIHNTLMLQKFLDGPMSILGCCVPDVGFEGAMTEAGFTGTIKVQDGQPVIVKGAAFEHRESILGIDEFSALTNSMKQDHSINLDSAMLTALDSGYLIKRLAMGKIQYITDMTLMTGSQPTRFDLSGGLGRRFIFLYFIPTKEESARIREFRRKAKMAFPSTSTMDKVKKAVREIRESLRKVKKITFDQSFFRKMDEFEIPHFEESLYERAALGYMIAKNNGADEHLHVSIDGKLSEMLWFINGWRKEIKKGAETSEVMLVVREMEGCKLSDIKQRLTDFGLQYSESTYLLNKLQKQRRIKFVKTRQSKGRPATVVHVLDF